MSGMRRKINTHAILLKVLFVLLFACTFIFSALGEGQETEDHRMEEWGQEWFGGDFSDVECGEVIIHISFSEDARKVFGTCEEPINVLIQSEGTWWTYGGRDWYSDVVTVTFDEKNGYQLRKKLPYGKYAITKTAYLGENSASYFNDYDYPRPYIYFEVSKEAPEIPVFVEFKKREGQDENSAVVGDSYDYSYHEIFNKAREKDINPNGKVRFHAVPENLEKEYFIVVEVAGKKSQEIGDIHYFGKTNDYTYTAEFYPGTYLLHRVYYIDLEGNVLGEDEVVSGYEFEALPQSDVIEVYIKIREKPAVAEVELSKKNSSETAELVNTGTSAEIETYGEGFFLTNENDPQNKIRMIIYYLIGFLILSGLAGAGIYCWKTKK